MNKYKKGYKHYQLMKKNPNYLAEEMIKKETPRVAIWVIVIIAFTVMMIVGLTVCQYE